LRETHRPMKYGTASEWHTQGPTADQ
jgi:hypothetical protein